MSNVVTDAVVLRNANYGESNRMLTLLTPDGLMSVSAKGCRKPTSKMLAASELFAAGEYVLYQRGDRYTLTSFQMQQNYYPIRTDIDKLSHGVYWLNLCEAAAQPCEDCHRLLKMLLLSLAVLAFDDLPPRALTAVFLIQFAGLQGFSPRLDACIRCGKPLTTLMRFDAALGGACCAGCAERGTPLSIEALAWMREAQAKGAFVLAGRRPLPQGSAETVDEAFTHLRAQVEHRLDRQITSGKLL